MKSGKRKSRIHVRISFDEEEQLAEIYRLSNSKGTFSAFIRNLVLGRIEHPFSELRNSLLDPTTLHNNMLDPKATGALNGPYDSLRFYQSMVLAAEYLKITQDPEYRKVIKENKPAFDKILRQLRGYEFDEKEAVKIPLNKGH